MENENKFDFSNLDDLLSTVDLEGVTSEGSGNFQELPDGYYNCEVVNCKLTESKTSNQPMVAFEFKTIGNGHGVDDLGEYVENKKTDGKRINLYYVLKDERSVKRFVTDMLKFEGEEPGVSLLGKEYFTNSELIEEALDCLVGSRIYIQISTTVNDDDSKSVWKNMISWKRVAALELPQ